MTSQSHFTLSFPLKTPADAKALAEQLPPLMPGLFQAQDTIGTVHYSRFTVLSERTLLFLGDFDGEFSQLMADLARLAGPVFDATRSKPDRHSLALRLAAGVSPRRLFSSCRMRNSIDQSKSARHRP